MVNKQSLGDFHRRNHGSKSGGTNLRGPKGQSSKPEGLRAGVGFLGRGQLFDFGVFWD